jgi:hypothetical protein
MNLFDATRFRRIQFRLQCTIGLFLLDAIPDHPSPKDTKVNPFSAPLAAFVTHIEPRAPFEYRRRTEA